MLGASSCLLAAPLSDPLDFSLNIFPIECALESLIRFTFPFLRNNAELLYFNFLHVPVIHCIMVPNLMKWLHQRFQSVPLCSDWSEWRYLVCLARRDKVHFLPKLPCFALYCRIANVTMLCLHCRHAFFYLLHCRRVFCFIAISPPCSAFIVLPPCSNVLSFF